jgi:hypothetical protein
MSFLLVVPHLPGCKEMAAYQYTKGANRFPCRGEKSQRTSSLSRCWTMLLVKPNQRGDTSITASCTCSFAGGTSRLKPFSGSNTRGERHQ